ncbi:triose-phosphate isomerase [candidate division TA06 bacterium]|uniref:Triosephosphate isomerase n=1 Tax=candidate division TA06 bacterium TaxID=2250710 RepID=A0A933ML87_UNCT6|nr:triose-phosphate isomerase [candidate division TA06 bacterium]
MRKPIIAGNWKMYKTVAEAKALAEGIVKTVKEVQDACPENGKQSLAVERVEVVLCPPFTALSVVSEIIKDTGIKLGAQNCYFQEKGAFTGEISPKFLLDFGCKYVIIGHSERRQYFGEDDALINRKLKTAMGLGLCPIFCIGETLDQRNQKQTFDVLKGQVLKGLEGIGLSDPLKMALAYEPVWAIGTGVTATKEQAQEVHQYLRGLLSGLWGQDIAGQVRIQYGGSVKPENIAELMDQPDIDGALVGGASLEPESFSRIINFKG